MKYHVQAQSTISLNATVEADSEEEALDKAADLDIPTLCYACSAQSGNGDVWLPDMDGEPVKIAVME